MSKPYPKEVNDFLRANVVGRHTKEVAEMLKAELGFELDEIKINRWKTRNHMKSGFDSKFQKGHKSPNKGKPAPPEVVERLKKTMFKKGHTPHNKNTIGTTMVDVEGYKWIKIGEPDVWQQYQRYIWEQEYGPIPEGMRLRFKDGDRSNVTLDNLILISKEDHIVINASGLSKSMTKETAESVVACAKLIRAKKQAQRRAKDGSKKERQRISI